MTSYELVSGPKSGDRDAVQEVQEPTQAGSSIDTPPSILNKDGPLIPKRMTTQEPSATSNIPTQRYRRTETAIRAMMTPLKPIGEAPGFVSSFKAIILNSWLNVLLIFIPVTWVLHFVIKKHDTIVFITSFLAIIPLAMLLEFATDELAMRVGQILATLLHVTLGNAVELVVAIIALLNCELRSVQSILAGSILGNLLLGLGVCFFIGGLKYSQQGLGMTATRANTSLLAISVMAFLLPAAYYFSTDGGDSNERAQILALSRGASFLLLLIYSGYLVFQLYSHAELYDKNSEDILRSTKYIALRRLPNPRTMQKKSRRSLKPRYKLRDSSGVNSSDKDIDDVEAGIDHEEDEEVPQMNVWTTFGLLVVATLLLVVTAKCLIDSMDGITQTGKLNKEFVGIILVPFTSKVAEHVMAVSTSVKDKLDSSISDAIGSSIQVAVFIIPFMIMLAWILGKPLTLLFDVYELVSVFLAVSIIVHLIDDGKSNWFKGLILMCLYGILCVTLWYYPGFDLSGILAQCV